MLRLHNAVATGCHTPVIPRNFHTQGIVNNIVDGDTIDVCINITEDCVRQVRLRIKGIDTPEMKGKTTLERQAAVRAAQVAAAYCNLASFFWNTKFGKPVFQNKAANQVVFVHIEKPDKYGGRWVGDVQSPTCSGM